MDFWNQTVQTMQNVANPDALIAQVDAQRKAEQRAASIRTIALVGAAALIVYLLTRKK
jgi:hypothetical protein